MKSLVVGFGSIGRRHARVLEDLGVEVAVLSRRPGVHPRQFATMREALGEYSPEYVVVANETSLHAGTLTEIRDFGFGGPILVEKPLTAKAGELAGLDDSNVYVGYNLRFHPLLQALRDRLASETLVTMEIHVGQWLPDWRPDADYRTGYSADRARGGGVLRDLSHELDYAAWISGHWTRLTAVGGHFSALEIDSDDAFLLLMATTRCPAVSIALNYLDRTTRRDLLVNTESGTYHLDLVRNRLVAAAPTEELLDEREVGRDDTYIAEHRAILSGEIDAMCRLSEGLDVMDTIAAAEEAAEKGVWITR